MKEKFIFILFCLLITSINAQNILTLDECINIALKNNRNIKQEIINKKAVEINYNQARNSRLPNLNAQLGQRLSYGRSLSADNTFQNSNSYNSGFIFSSGIVLFDGLQVKKNIEMQKMKLLAAGEDIKKIEKDIILNVSAVFLKVLLNKELLKIAENQIEITKSNLNRIEELINVGKLVKNELLEVEAQMAKEQLNIVKSKSELSLSLIELSQILEIDNLIDVIFKSEDEIISENILLSFSENIYEVDLSTRPEIKAAEYRYKSANINRKIIQSTYYPTISLGGSLESNYYKMSNIPNNIDFETQIKNNMSSHIEINLSIPIFNKYETKNKIKTSKLKEESMHLEIDNQRIELFKILQQAFHNANSMKEQWNSSKIATLAFVESYNFIVEKYELGRANIYEVNIAKNNLSQAISEEVQAKYEYLFALMILEQLYL